MLQPAVPGSPYNCSRLNTWNALGAHPYCSHQPFKNLTNLTMNFNTMKFLHEIFLREVEVSEGSTNTAVDLISPIRWIILWIVLSPNTWGSFREVGMMALCSWLCCLWGFS